MEAALGHFLRVQRRQLLYERSAFYYPKHLEFAVQSTTSDLLTTGLHVAQPRSYQKSDSRWLGGARKPEGEAIGERQTRQSLNHRPALCGLIICRTSVRSTVHLHFLHDCASAPDPSSISSLILPDHRGLGLVIQILSL
jgi:hypothetical protein